MVHSGGSGVSWCQQLLSVRRHQTIRPLRSWRAERRPCQASCTPPSCTSRPRRRTSRRRRGCTSPAGCWRSWRRTGAGLRGAAWGAVGQARWARRGAGGMVVRCAPTPAIPRPLADGAHAHAAHHAHLPAAQRVKVTAVAAAVGGWGQVGRGGAGSAAFEGRQPSRPATSHPTAQPQS